MYIPLHIYTPELGAQTTLFQSGEVYHAEEFRRIGEVILIDVILVESSSPYGKVIMRILLFSHQSASP